MTTLLELRPKSSRWISWMKQHISLRKQPTFREVATWALAYRGLSNERRNSILMTCLYQILVALLIGLNFLSTNQKHHQDLGSARHQYGISVLVTQTSFCEGSSGDLAKHRLFSQANNTLHSCLFLSPWLVWQVSEQFVKSSSCFRSDPRSEETSMVNWKLKIIKLKIII